MPGDEIRFWLEVVASAAGVIGLSAIALELVRARRADARDFLFHTHEKYEELYWERQRIRELTISTLDELVLLSREGDAEGQKAWFDVFNFWDLLTRTVRSKAIDKQLAIEHFGRPFISYHHQFSGIHRELEAIEGGFDWYESFEWFAEVCETELPNELEAIEKGNAYFAKVIAAAS